MTEMISITVKVNGSEQAAAIEPRRSLRHSLNVAEQTIAAQSYMVRL